MTQDKFRKVVTACTVAATALFVFLLGYLIYQFITIGILDKKEKRLIDNITQAQERIEEGEKDLAYYQDETYIQWWLLQLNNMEK